MNALANELRAAYKMVKQRDEAFAAHLRSLPTLDPDAQSELNRLDAIIKKRNSVEQPLGSGNDDDEEDADTNTPAFGILEINHDPVEPDCLEQEAGWTRNSFEYVVLVNLSDGQASTEGLKFTKGISFSFPSIQLPSRGLVVVARNPDAVKSRYIFPAGTPVVGPYEHGLSAKGEQLKLVRKGLGNARETMFDFEFVGDWLASQSRHALLNHALNALLQDESQPTLSGKLDQDALSLDTTWVGYLRETNAARIDRMIPEVLMYHASSPQAEKHDFVVLANTSNRTLNLDRIVIGGGIRAELQGTLASGKRIVLASDRTAFMQRYGTIGEHIIEYDGKLSNDHDDFELTCKAPADPKRLWRVKYQQGDWPATVNGGGWALRPVNICSQPPELREATAWEPVQHSDEIQRDPVCPVILHLSYSCASPFGPAILVTHDPKQTSAPWGDGRA